MILGQNLPSPLTKNSRKSSSENAYNNRLKNPVILGRNFALLSAKMAEICRHCRQKILTNVRSKNCTTIGCKFGQSLTVILCQYWSKMEVFSFYISRDHWLGTKTYFCPKFCFGDVRNRASVGYLLCEKHRSASKQAKEGLGGFFSRMESLILCLTMSNRVLSGERIFCVCLCLIESIVCAGALVSLVTTEELR